MRRLMILAATGLLVAACGGIGVPNFTIPPINIPSFSFPPFEIPSGLPSLDATGNCALVTSAEMSSIWGSAPIAASDSGDCTYTFSNGATIGITTQSNTDLASSKIALGNSAKDITVAGLPAVQGALIIVNQPAVHVQRGTDQLQVQGILVPADDPTFAKLVQVATLAVSRWQ